LTQVDLQQQIEFHLNVLRESVSIRLLVNNNIT
jgi:hypothetical protein